MRKAAFHNLGCKVNAYETEAMEQMLEAAGYEIVPFAPGADVYVINTCSVTNIADRKSRQMLHRAKKMNPEAVVVAAGCYVQAAGRELAEKDEAVDIVIGNDRKKELVQILDRYFQEKTTGEEPEDVYLKDLVSPTEYEELHISRVEEHTRAFIKVQDGCNQFCSYCIIPYTRGRVRSRRPEDVAEEIRGLAAQGYKEMVLTGIHLSSYGVDFPGGRPGLMDLIAMVHEIDGVERIRLGSLEPRIITEESAGFMAGLKKLCPHFHLSLQSGCEETLKRMNRKYTTEEYLEKCEILRKHFDRPAITTDVIVGFPGETEEEFEQTRAFVERVHFYEMHVFKYSRRKGTRADRMDGQVPEPVKAERSDVLLELEKTMSEEYRRLWLRETVDLLLEEEAEIDGKPVMTGCTREYVKCVVEKKPGMEKGMMVRGTASKLLDGGVMEVVTD